MRVGETWSVALLLVIASPVAFAQSDAPAAEAPAEPAASADVEPSAEPAQGDIGAAESGGAEAADASAETEADVEADVEPPQADAAEGQVSPANADVEAEASVEADSATLDQAAAAADETAPEEVEGQQTPAASGAIEEATDVTVSFGAQGSPDGEGRFTISVHAGYNENQVSQAFVPPDPPVPIDFAPPYDAGEGAAGQGGVAPATQAPTPAAKDVDEMASQTEASASPPGPTAAQALAATTVVAGAAGVGFLAVPGWRTAVSRAFRLARYGIAAAFFSRLSEEELLGHPRRSEIVEYVRQNPGERLEVIRRALNIPNGAMVHHVRILSQRDLLRVVRIDGMSRVYTAGPRVRPVPYVPPLRRRLLDHLRAAPGATQRELAHAFGLSERVVSYHVGWLREQGLLTVRRDGASKRCFPIQAPHLGTSPELTTGLQSPY